MTAMVTIVTGAAGALGSGVATHLLTQGTKVALVDRAEAEVRLASLAAAHAPLASWSCADVSDGDDWTLALANTEAQLGPITGAVLCAGGWSGGRAFHESKEEVWQQMFERNLLTAKTSLQKLTQYLVQRGHGSVVLVGARPAVRPWEATNMAEYAASKAAVVALAQAVAQEVLRHDVRINVILPSTIDTAANRASMPKADPLKWVSIASLSRVINFLLSDDARDISGAAIPVYAKS